MTRSTARSTRFRKLRRLARAVPLVALAGAWAAVAAAPPRFDEALAEQRRRVAENPADPGALNDLGNLLVYFHQLDEAEATYQRALDIDAAHIPSRYNLALVLLEQGERKRGRAELERVVELAPDHAWAHYQLGTVDAELGRRHRAIRNYARAFARDPSLADPINNPHVVGNALATQAMLKSYDDQLPAVQVPRSYVEPQRVTEFLLPEPPAETGAPEDEPAAEGEPQAGRRGQRLRGTFAPAEPEEEEVAGSAEAVDRVYGDDSPDDADAALRQQMADQLPLEEEAESDYEAEDTAGSRRRRPRRGGEQAVPTFQGGTVFTAPGQPVDGARAPEAAAPGQPPSQAPTPSAAPPVSGSRRRPAPIEPEVTSTGRLELELFPAAQPQPAVIAT